MTLSYSGLDEAFSPLTVQSDAGVARGGRRRRREREVSPEETDAQHGMVAQLPTQPLGYQQPPATWNQSTFYDEVQRMLPYTFTLFAVLVLAILWDMRNTMNEFKAFAHELCVRARPLPAS